MNYKPHKTCLEAASYLAISMQHGHLKSVQLHDSIIYTQWIECKLIYKQLQKLAVSVSILYCYVHRPSYFIISHLMEAIATVSFSLHACMQGDLVTEETK